MLRVCLLLLAAFVMSTVSVPEDEVVPETASTLSQLSTRHPELKNSTPKDAAHAKIRMLQAQGFDNTKCSQMATDAISGMTSTLKAEQDAMDALSTGADCLVTTPATRRLAWSLHLQQHYLDAAAQALVASKADLATKEATLQAKKVAPITLTINLDTIGTDMAAIGAAVAADPAVVAAKQAVADAQTARDSANLVVVADQATYDASLVAAQDASQECLCSAKAAHDTAWPIAQKIVTDNTQAWKEAHHVKCAVDGNADDACSVPAFTVTDKPLITEASSADCATSVAPSAPSQGVLKLAGWGRDECLKPDEKGKLRFGQACDYEFVHLESGALASASDNSKCIIGSLIQLTLKLFFLRDLKLGPCPGAMSFQFSTAARWNEDEVQCISVNKGKGGIGWLTDLDWAAPTTVPIIVDQEQPGALCDPQSFPVDYNPTNGEKPWSKNFYWVAW